MHHVHSAFRSLTVALAAAGSLALAMTAGAQVTSIGLSTVRSQRFGNDNLGGIFTPQAGDQLAYSLAAGDFDGDGADDLATGMPFDNGPTARPVNDSGSVVVRYSTRGSGLTTNPSQIYLRQQSDPPEPGDNFGWSLAACDFNQDAIDDLAVGVPHEDYLGEDDGGIVHVYYGSSAGLQPNEDGFFAQSTPGVPEDVEWRDRFGWSLACGDFDGDTFDDLAVGVPGETWGGGGPFCPPGGRDCAAMMGSVFVVPGSRAGLDYGATTVLGQDAPGMSGEGEDGDALGWSLAAGDFDDDGFDDLAIGVPGEDGQGAIQVVRGSPSGPVASGNVLLHQDQAGGGATAAGGDDFGATLAAGDFDGDGVSDLVAAAPHKDVGTGDDAGQVSVLFGAAGGFDLGRTLVLDEDRIFGAGTSESRDELGLTLAVGDFTNDGFDDLAIGHPGETVVGVADGAVTVLTGFSGGVSLARRRQIVGGVAGFPGNPTQTGERFGSALADGDFDGDSHADLAIGSRTEDEGGVVDVGAEAVLYGAVFADGAETGNTSLWSQTASFPNGNTIRATAAAKLGPTSSRFGLQVDLYNPTPLQPGAATFVRVGPEAGFNSERTLDGTFFVDPQGLTMSPNPGVNIFSMMTLADGVGAGSKTRLTFELNRNDSVGGWAIIANSFNEAANALQFAGGAGFAANDPGDPNTHNNRIDWSWRAGNPGHLTVWHTRYVNGVPDTRRLLFDVDLPGASNAAIKHAFAGMVAGQDAGTYGAFFLDEISFRR
ncbi:MAG TPA: FG-GAP repeat protein [Thermoanaerobaculia bacterium]|nr:FG-GAP repeat protein [Thermoanaerobaculia bacterium]